MCYMYKEGYMNELSEMSINIEEVCQLDGLVHVYATDLNHRILACNKTQALVAEEVFGISRKDFIGTPLKELINNRYSNCNEVIKVVLEENDTVINSRLPRQFYNVWVAKGLYILELLTIKMPFYTKQGKLGGVLGFSHYISKFSIREASNLGLSKRETECLLHLLEGKSNKEIASQLFISVRTVESYIDSIKTKLGCFNKSELLSKAVQSKLTDGVNDGLALLHNKMQNLTHDSFQKLHDKFHSNINHLVFTAAT